MPDDNNVYDEVEIANVNAAHCDYRVECRAHREKAWYYGEWVTVNGDAFTTETYATISGAIAVEYVPAGDQDPSGIKLIV